MSIRSVVFDFGNVLAFFSHQRAAEQLLRFARRPVPLERLIQFLFYTELEPRYEVGQLTSSEVLNLLRQEFDLVGSDEQLRQAFGDIFHANEAVCRMIPSLQNKYRLVLLSNTNEMHYNVFRRQFADVLDRFDHLFVSHEVGLRKPDPKLFQFITDRVGGAPAEFVFIDDLASNIRAACDHGWKGIIYNKDVNLANELIAAGVQLPA